MFKFSHSVCFSEKPILTGGLKEDHPFLIFGTLTNGLMGKNEIFLSTGFVKESYFLYKKNSTIEFIDAIHDLFKSDYS